MPTASQKNKNKNSREEIDLLQIYYRGQEMQEFPEKQAYRHACHNANHFPRLLFSAQIVQKYKPKYIHKDTAGGQNFGDTDTNIFC